MGEHRRRRTAWAEHLVDGDFDFVRSVSAADVDGDGDVDVLGAAATDDEITWWENTGPCAGAGGACDTWIEHGVGTGVGTATSVYAKDMDSDGDLDVLGAAKSDNDILWWENTAGDGSIWTEHTVDASFSGARSVYATDLDGDGDIDVLGAAEVGDTITWWENETIHRSAVYPTEHTIDGAFGQAASVYAADIDGDGDSDVLGAAYGTNEITWWENAAGDGSTWIEQIISGAFTNAESVYAADVDGDGDIDVLGAASDADDITWWENTAGDGSSWAEHVIAGAFNGALSVYATDVDGDGDTDVLGAAAIDDDIAWFENTLGDGSAGPNTPSPERSTGPIRSTRRTWTAMEISTCSERRALLATSLGGRTRSVMARSGRNIPSTGPSSPLVRSTRRTWTATGTPTCSVRLALTTTSHGGRTRRRRLCLERARHRRDIQRCSIGLRDGRGR